MMLRLTLALVLLLTLAVSIQTLRLQAWSSRARALEQAQADWTRDRTALEAAIADRDAAAEARATREAASLAELQSLSAADVTSAFQKGLAAGRAIADVQTPALPSGSAASVGGVHDYRQAWSLDAYRPGA